MAVPVSKELLEYLLAGHRLNSAQLDELVKSQPREDQYLDYKNGQLLSKGHEGAVSVTM